MLRHEIYIPSALQHRFPPGLALIVFIAVREDFKTQKRAYDKSEDDLKALQSVGQIIGEVLRQLDDEKCTPPLDSRSSLNGALHLIPL